MTYRLAPCPVKGCDRLHGVVPASRRGPVPRPGSGEASKHARSALTAAPAASRRSVPMDPLPERSGGIHKALSGG